MSRSGKKPTEVGKWGLDTAENTGRDGSPVGSVSVGSASPLADTENSATQPNFQTEVWAVKNAPENNYSVAFSETELNHNNPITNPLVEGTRQTLYGAGSTAYNKNAGARVTLAAISVVVPAFTRYTAQVNFIVQNNGRREHSGANAPIYTAINSYGVSEIDAFYGSSLSSWQGNWAAEQYGGKGTSVVWYTQTTKTLEFDNASSETKTLRYFFHMGGAINAGSIYKNYCTVTNYVTLYSSGMQRLVPTSYDVEYDQLRHSLEEEYYEAIRLDENYPTEADPPRFVPTFSGPLHVSNSEQTKLLNIIFYFNVTTVTPLSPSPYLPRRNDSTRRCPCKRRWTAERSFPVPIPCTMRT